MGDRTSNRSYDTAGLEDPARHWMQRLVRVKTHPEWGLARVTRWYPAEADHSARLRIMPHGGSVQRVVDVTDVEVA